MHCLAHALVCCAVCTLYLLLYDNNNNNNNNRSIVIGGAMLWDRGAVHCGIKCPLYDYLGNVMPLFLLPVQDVVGVEFEWNSFFIVEVCKLLV